MIAQKCELATMIAVAPERPGTVCGVSARPSVPSSLSTYWPQHFAVPSPIRAQVFWSAASIATTLVTPTAVTGPMRRSSVPSPSWPTSFIPQHLTVFAGAASTMAQ